MKLKTYLPYLLTILFAVSFCSCLNSAPGNDQPNIVIIYTDDQEPEQLGCDGGNILFV